jgi:hypothetical protein
MPYWQRISSWQSGWGAMGIIALQKDVDVMKYGDYKTNKN